MRALVSDLGDIFVEGIAPDLEHRPKFPETLSNIRKDDARSGLPPFWTICWAAFHRADHDKREDFQLFVVIGGGLVHWGMYAGSAPAEELRSFAVRLRSQPALAARALAAAKAARLEFRNTEDFHDPQRTPVLEVETIDDLARLLEEAQPIHVHRWLASDDAVAAGPGLANRIADTFRAVWPLYAFAIRPDPAAELADFFDASPSASGVPGEDERYNREQLLRDTGIASELLDDIEASLREKPQMVFYGPPGTGKTWLAERLADYLVRDGGRPARCSFIPRTATRTSSRESVRSSIRSPAA